MMELPALVPNGACLMCARESREVEKERGADRWVVRVSPCLDGRRVLSQSIHTDSARLLYTELPYCHLETRPGPPLHTHTHTPGPCASDTRLRRYHSCHLARVSALQTTARPKSRTIAFL